MMELKGLVDAILGVVEEVLLALRSGITWRRVKKLIRRYVWKPYIQKAIQNQDFGWVDDALILLALIRLLTVRFARAPESLKHSSLSHKSMLKTLANQ
jgi:hypothetical protein